LIPHTQAFKRLKDEAQKTFDFAIVVCYAVPSLKATLGTLQPDAPLPFAPDHFDTRPIPTEKVRNHVAEYKEVLSRHVFLSSFSYFEAYFVELLREIVAFHGKANLLSRHDSTRNAALTDPALLKAKRKLQEHPVPSNLDAYRNYGKRLAASGFIFPSAALARHGLKQLIELAASDKIRSVEIPDLIQSVLQLPLDPESDVKQYNQYRGMRNKIAHGQPKKVSLHLKMAIEANNFLRNLALRIDNHVVANLLLVEL